MPTARFDATTSNPAAFVAEHGEGNLSSTSSVTWVDAVAAIAAIATPLVVVGLGFVVNRRLKQVEDQQWRGRALIEARLQYYGELAGGLNDLMCYFTYIGIWKELDPPEVIRIKRSLDRSFAMYRPFFSQATVDAYGAFMDCCFHKFGGPGPDAALKTGYRRRSEAAGPDWRTEWNRRFTVMEGDEVTSDLEECRHRYSKLVESFVEDIKLTSPRGDYVTARISRSAH